VSYNASAICELARRAIESSTGNEEEPNFIPFRVPIDHIFNAIKDQPWVRCQTRLLLPNLKGLGSKTTVPSMKEGVTSQ